MAVLWAVAGLIVGSFLNLLIYRLPRLEKLAAPVRCPYCRVQRPFYSQSALLSSLLGTKGKCAVCGAPADKRAVTVEIATGMAFWLLFLRFGVSPRLLMYSLYTCFLVVVFTIDWQHRLILNRVTYPGILLSILLTPLLSEIDPPRVLLGLAVGGVIFGLLYGGGYLLYRQEVLGLGDVKLAMLLGAMVGFPTIVMALLMGSLFGAVAAVAMLISRRRSSHDFMPYGTAMCLGAFLTFFIDASYFS